MWHSQMHMISILPPTLSANIKYLSGQFSVYQIEKDYVVPCCELISKAYAWREL